MNCHGYGKLNVLLLLISLFTTGKVYSQSTSISGTINIYTPVTGFDTTLCPAKIIVQSSVGLSVNDKILIIQMKGCDFDSSNSSSFGSINNLMGAGNYEIASITAMNNNTLTLNGKLVNQYYLKGSVQVVRIPTYVSATVTSSLTCLPWNGSVGGVVILEAGFLQLNADIDVSGRGFRGGTISGNPDGGCGSGSLGYYYDVYQGGSSWSTGGAQKGEGIGFISPSKLAGRGPLINGGGGGNKHNTGGGGGSNFTSGGKGGNELSGCSTHAGGIGGVALGSYYSSSKLFLGGGGGCGDANNGVGTTGENGGGIVIVICNTIVATSSTISIRSNGRSVVGLAGAAADGAGGGGAGGTIFLKSSQMGTSFHLEANGGDGGGQNPSGYCVGPGGGGGTGVILTSLSSLFGTYSLVPGNPGVIVSGGCINTAYGSLAGTTNTTGALTSMSLIYTPNSSASFSAVSSSPAICKGSTVILTASGAATYTWFPGSVNGTSISVSPSVSAIYTVFATKANACTGSITLLQVVNPIPTVTAFSSNGIICSSTAATLSATGASNYTWLPGGLTGSAISVSPSSTTTYSVVGSANNCTNNASVVQSVNITPTLVISPGSLTVCPGETFTLLVSGASSYVWSPSTVTTALLTSSITSSSVFSVTGTAVTGCTASALISVVAKPTPVLLFNTYSITCGSLGSATVLPSGGVGPYSYTWTPTGQTSVIATGLYPGAYTVTVLDSGTGCVFTPTTNFAPLVPLTGTVSASSSIACNGVYTGTASILLSGGSATQNYTWASIGGAQATPTVANLGAGVTTITVVDALTYCALTKTILITQPPAITLNIQATGQSTCIGQNITFTVAGAGGTPGYSYTWSPGITGNINTVTNNSPGTYSYVVQGRDANNCLASATATAAFVNFPAIAVISTSICPGSAGALIATGGTTYTWSTGSQANVLIAGPPATTQYTVTGMQSSCTNTATGIIFVFPSVAATPSNNGPVCAGLPFTLFSNEPQSFWTGPLGYTNTVQNPTIPVTTMGSAGSYTLKVTSVNGCTAVASTPVTINPLPVFSAIGSTVCEHQNLVLTASGISGATYLWTGMSFSAAVQSPVISNALPVMTGNYSVQVTTAAGCSSMAAVHASVALTPTPVISANGQQCMGTALALSGSGGDLYFWQGPGNFSSGLQNPSISNFTSGGIFTLTVVQGPCTTSVTKNILVLPLPNAVITSNSPVCEDTPIQLDGSGGQTYQWTGPSFFSNSQKNTIAAASFSNAGNYTLTVTDINTCTASVSVPIIIKAVPIVSAMGATVCIGEAAVLSASGGTAYLWSGPFAFTSTQSSPSIPVVNSNNTGLYQVVVTGSNGCSKSETVVIAGNPFPLPVATITSSPKACLNSAVVLHGGGGTIFEWKGPNNFSASDQDVSFVVQDHSWTGTYTLSVKNASNCSATATTYVSVYDQPKGTLNVLENNKCAPVCTGIALDNTSGNIAPVIGTTLYVNNQPVTGTGKVHCFSEGGTYTLNMVFEDSNGCKNNSFIQVVVYQRPQADFYFMPSEPLAEIDNVRFFNGTSGSQQTEWSWWFTQNDSQVVLTRDASYMFADAGNYPVVMVAKNAWGCADTVIKTVKVVEEFVIYVPNVFTPNGDGLNDIFMPLGEGVTKYNLTVYDRWGEKLFETKDFFHGWDGSYKGEPCKSDVYQWSIDASDRLGKIKRMTGHVTIVKGNQPE